MKKIYLSILFFAIAFYAIAQKTILNDANAESRTLSGSFNAIKVSNGIDLYISQYQTESLAVSASEQKFRDHIKTIIQNKTLLIYYDGDNKWGTSKKMKVYVSFNELRNIQASGSSDVQVSGTIEGDQLGLEMSGSSDFKGDIKVKELSIRLSGSSDAKLSGTANNVTIESSGASDVTAYNLITETCTAKASGASDVKLTITKTLKATASGASDIFYKGSAIIEQEQSSGSSSILKKE